MAGLTASTSDGLEHYPSVLGGSASAGLLPVLGATYAWT